MPGASDAERIRKADRPSRLMARKPRRRMSPPAPEARKDGAVAQLGERLPCTQEVRSSILLGSTNFQNRSPAIGEVIVKRLYATVCF